MHSDEEDLTVISSAIPPDQAVSMLASLIGNHGGDAPSLDYSYESLDRLEWFLRQIIEKKIVHPYSRETLRWLLGAYLGEVLRRNVGGRWGIRDGAPAVLAIPGLTKEYSFIPTRTIRAFGRDPGTGRVRQAVEKHDLALMATKLETFCKELPSWVKRFEVQSGHKGLTLDGVAQAERILADARPRTEEAETAYQLCSRFVGEVVREESHGRWDFPRDAMQSDFGWMCVGHRVGHPANSFFNPWVAVGGYLARSEQGRLVAICERGIRPSVGG